MLRKCGKEHFGNMQVRPDGRSDWDSLEIGLGALLKIFSGHIQKPFRNTARTTTFTYGVDTSPPASLVA